MAPGALLTAAVLLRGHAGGGVPLEGPGEARVDGVRVVGGGRHVDAFRNCKQRKYYDLSLPRAPPLTVVHVPPLRASPDQVVAAHAPDVPHGPDPRVLGLLLPLLLGLGLGEVGYPGPQAAVVRVVCKGQFSYYNSSPARPWLWLYSPCFRSFFLLFLFLSSSCCRNLLSSISCCS